MIFMSNSEEEREAAEVKPMSIPVLIFFTLLGTGFQIPFFFPVAGDWAWIEAWVYLASFAILYMGFVLVVNKKNPEVIHNRMKAKKERVSKPGGSDKYILPILGLLWAITFILPGLDYRYFSSYRWTDTPIYIEIVGFILMVAGFYYMFRSMIENAYASKVLDIRSGHKVIDTGLYAHVRHPMYSGFSLMIVGVPLLLGSWLSVIPALFCVILFLVRIKFEEEMLTEGLEGYPEYCKRVKYKLIPKII